MAQSRFAVARPAAAPTLVGMRRTHLISSLLAIAVSAMLLAACGGGDDDDGGNASASTRSSSSQPASNASSSAVKIEDFKFQPSTLTVKSGAQVSVTNDDSTAHTATADDNSFDTGTVDPGSSGTISVNKPGSYAYHCSIHPFMHGTLVVK
jgi:plastocyanin